MSSSRIAWTRSFLSQTPFRVRGRSAAASARSSRSSAEVRSERSSGGVVIERHSEIGGEFPAKGDGLFDRVAVGNTGCASALVVDVDAEEVGLLRAVYALNEVAAVDAASDLNGVRAKANRPEVG